MIEDLAYVRLKKRLIAHTGLTYYSNRDKDLTEQIGRRLAELDLPNCRAYTDLLTDAEAGPAELDVMVARINIGETYFFRDQEQFDALRKVVLPEIINRKSSSKQLWIWSSGCASGCEPYSLAILLGREFERQLAQWNVRILGTDISRLALAEAAEGRFGQWALRSTPEEVRSDSFSKDGPTWTVLPKYKKPVSFRIMNLMEDSFSFPGYEPTSFDLILCRNVMIYFAPEVKNRLMGQFHDSLADDGWFLMGTAEHDLRSAAAFRTVYAPGVMMFRKKHLEPLANARGSVSAIGSVTPPASPPASVNTGFNLDGLRQLANRGDWENTVQYYHQLSAQDGLNSIADFYHGMVLEQMGISEEAEKSLRRAIYLDRNFLMAHLHLGLTLTKEKESRKAALSFQNVLKLSSAMPDDQLVMEGGGMTVADLKELVEMQLRHLSLPGLDAT